MECANCHKTDDEARIEKCPICFKGYCPEHAYLYSGRRFCSKPCAEYFFFGDGDD